MTPKKIEELIKARRSEIEAVQAAFTKRKAETQKIVDAYQQFGNQCQLKVTHLEGCISELRRQLPKPKEKKKK